MCVKPITIKVEQSGPNMPPFRMVQVPCGKCPICVQKYQNSWMIRLSEELKDWPVSTFLTLTYRSECVPLSVNKSTGESYNSVCKDHVVRFLKYFRTTYKRHYGKPAKFKYFFCSEYGPLTFRPHFHAIIFGLSPIELHFALAYWRKNFGFVSAKKIDLSSVKSMNNTSRYVAKYCAKGQFENPLVELGKVQPTFRMMSKGLGIRYVQKHMSQILSNSLGGNRLEDIADKLIYNINGFNYALPRYYKDKILPPKTLLRSKVASAVLARNDAIYNTKLRELCSSEKIGENEAVNTLYFQEIDAVRCRDNEAKDRQNKIQKKSKI